MQKIKLYISLGLLFMFTMVNSQNTNSFTEVITTEDVFTAGDTIVLKFKGVSSKSASLYCSSSYGTTLIMPKHEGELALFTVPTWISSKSGLVQWKLNIEHQNSYGKFFIQPQTTTQSMETYLGPPSIQAGNRDYAMMVTIPTDALDNPLKDSSIVDISYQFKNLEESESILSKNLIAYTKIYAPSENGRILLSAAHKGIASKEFTLVVYPANPNDFEIMATRPHDYADGNQITTFKSSIIKDSNGNIVSDGTYVEFIISTKKGVKLKTTGATINGRATAYMIHPDKASEWRVKALIEGMAESNELAISFKQGIQTFNTALTENNRRITVGPIKSFMNQLVPDGLEVKIELYLKDNIVYKELKTTKDGLVHFILKPDMVPPGTYNIKASAAGLASDIKNVTLW